MYAETESIYRWPCGCQWRGIRAEAPLNAEYGFICGTPCVEHYDCIEDEDVLRISLREFAEATGLRVEDAEYFHNVREYGS